ncbi:ABC transporter substrate-binding protein [Heyndrickxia oleronia]|uniref:Sugar ABC transporter substrate-binding protein n=1 Tax=Heyndrickxia oleronia TaxID=38875 RepID=A0AAW6T0E9_9BACI|nr:sugar ABC transporter substrate-binding protein [Heyndrickxia oleronia]MDH5162199.1 sugar ABC transporter substrate-binding protein [Heyndrickxia oleronia]
MKKVRWLSMLLLVFVLILVTACSNKESAGGDGKGKKKNVEIKFWTISLSPTFDDYINGIIDKFEAENPGVTVKWEDIPFENVEQKTLTAAASGQLADVMNLNTDFLKKLSAVGAILNLSEKAADVKDDYFEGVLQSGMLNDKLYALPWYLSNSGLLYNKDLLAKAGFDKPPATEDEAWKMSEVLYKKLGVYGSTIGDIHLYLPQNGVPLVSEDLKSAAVNTPKALEIFKTFKKRFDDGLIPKELLLKQAQPNEWYAQEKIAWWGTGPQLYRQVKDLAPEVYDKSDAAPAILGSEGVAHVAIMNIAVAAKSKAPDEAVAFAKFVTNAESQLAFSKIVAVLPSVKAAAQDEFFTQGKDSEDPSEKGRYFAAKQLETSRDMFAPVENISEINKAINEEFQKVLLENKDPQKALDDAEDKINNLLK